MLNSCVRNPVNSENGSLADGDKNIQLDSPEERLSFSNASAELNRALEYCQQNDSNTGIKKINSLYSKLKNDKSYWNSIAMCFLEENDPWRARAYLLRVLEEDPSDAVALNNLGYCYWKMKRPQDALFYFKKARNTNQSPLVINSNLARIYLWFGLNEKSKSYYQQKNNLSNTEILYQAINFAATKDYKKSLLLFSDLPSLKSFNSRSLAIYALALQKNGEIEKAREILDGLEKNNFLPEGVEWLIDI